VWLLIDAAFGYVVLVDAEPVTADQIDLAGVETIDYLLPEDREEDNVSVSLDPSDVSWHESEQITVHVGNRYHEAELLLAKQPDMAHAEDALEKLNSKLLEVNGGTFAPIVGLAGLLVEFADNYRHYIETTPWWKVRWHMWKDRTPWLEE
jgi:hypothetical protein